MLRNCEQFGQKKIVEGEMMQIYPEILKVTNVKFLLYNFRAIFSLCRLILGLELKNLKTTL